ncbi:hypothetical protein Tco_1274493 [Tanacetum coccineum]
MCNKKNSVLFTKTECLILSPDFKLLDESQVLLKVPRHNNMYSFDLKNVVPSGGKAACIVVIWLGKNPNSSRVWPFLGVVHNSSKDARLSEAATTITGSNKGLYYSLKLRIVGVYITTAIGKQLVLLICDRSVTLKVAASAAHEDFRFGLCISAASRFGIVNTSGSRTVQKSQV